MSRDANKVVGYVTHLGMLTCTACALKVGPVWVGRFSGVVFADTSPHNVEACDFCAKSLTEEKKS
jgi:hypothetical protein